MSTKTMAAICDLLWLTIVVGLSAVGLWYVGFALGVIVLMFASGPRTE